MAPNESEDDSDDGDDPLVEPLQLITAQTLARSILRDGSYVFTTHALERLEEHGMSQVDVVNTLRAGRCVLFNFEKGTYRYQFETVRGYHAVVAFRSTTEMVVVTAWK